MIALQSLREEQSSQNNKLGHSLPTILASIHLDKRDTTRHNVQFTLLALI